MATPMRVPLATYRVQLNADFTFDDAAGIVDYLEQLGITDLYASPILQARAGSTHGYDVADPTRLSGDLGGDEAFERLSAQLSERGMGLLLDIVPNHMAASLDNPWWLDVLRHGPESRYATFFDINWDARRPGLKGKVLLPILGDHVDAVLERGEIELERAGDEAWIRYYDWRLPISESPASRAALEVHVSAIEKGDDEAKLETLDTLLESQHYRLAFWRLANQEINYRRFFDITDLVSLRIDDPTTFDDVHRHVLELIGEGRVTGLRIDHVDGLRDPRGYLEKLQRVTSETAGRPFYIVVEKILVGDETLPEGWPVAGTTGYDFLNRVNGLMADGRAAESLNELYRRYTGSDQEFHELVRRAKHFVIRQLFAGDLRRLGTMLWHIADVDRRGRDLPEADLEAAIAEFTACFPVYRSYATGDSVRPEDRRLIQEATAEARERRPDLAKALDLLERVLLLDVEGDGGNAPASWIAFVERWQQFSGPVTAKGLEDTSLYIDTRLISMNAVGGEPEVLEISVSGYHRWIEQRARDWPHTMNASSTHDEKRSEDVRARINVLSEIVDEWAERVMRWRTLNRHLRQTPNGDEVPDSRTELLLYQTMLGAWPFEESEVDSFRERLKAYAIKAAREAKVYTSWIDQAPEYEEALLNFIDAIFDDSVEGGFLQDFRLFMPRIAWHGALNSLSQTLIKITTPGVPDFYRGAELWDLSLVDPDNRRPLDYDHYRAALERVIAVEPTEARQLFHEWQSGEIKLYLIDRALQARNAMRGVFERGDYQPLAVEGQRARHAVAIARRSGDEMVVTVVPRLTAKLVQATGGVGQDQPIGDAVWGDTRVRLPSDAPGGWTNVLTEGKVRAESGQLHLATLFADFPYALLVSS